MLANFSTIWYLVKFRNVLRLYYLRNLALWLFSFSLSFSHSLPLSFYHLLCLSVCLSLYLYVISDHCFIHKWLLLTDPEDPSAGAKGYLKISINVIGPGADPKPSPSTLSQDDVDIES